MGLDRPILHGLATMGMTAVAVAAAVGAPPADLSVTTARFSSPVYPGSRLRIDAETAESTAHAETSADGILAMSATFSF